MPLVDAIVLATDPLSAVRVVGLSVRERAIRIAKRVGAERVLVVDTADQLGGLVAWRGNRTASVLVIRADQLVHTPLVAPLFAQSASGDTLAIAVGPDDEYAGALLATGDAAARVVEQLAAGTPDREIAKAATARVPHGAIARHPVGTADERRGAKRLLYGLMVKSQDNVITRYMYRPFAAPLTKLLARTPITPNQISYTVAILVAIGCYLTLQGDPDLAIAGAGVILLGSYFDCCDGEIARLKLMSSRMGAWIDTIVDELSTFGYILATGYHCHLVFGPHYFGNLDRVLGVSPWIAAISISSVLMPWCIYCIYYNIIVAVGSANSQDYVGRFEVAPGSSPNAVRLRPKVAQAVVAPRELPKPVQILLEIAPNIVRRDFICWFSFFLAAMGWMHVTFAILFAGTVVTAVVLSIDHVKLRLLRRSIARAGQVLESPAR